MYGYLGLLLVRLLFQFPTVRLNVSIIVVVEALWGPLGIVIGKLRRATCKRGWESDSVQASMHWAMRMASLNVLGPWSSGAAGDVMA